MNRKQDSHNLIAQTMRGFSVQRVNDVRFLLQTDYKGKEKTKKTKKKLGFIIIKCVATLSSRQK